MKYPQINNGKKYYEPLNACILFWLPPDSPYGNLQLKMVDIVQKIDCINLDIINTFDVWNKVSTNTSMDESDLLSHHFNFMKHRFLNESIVYHIRKITDELICLVYVLNYYKTYSKFPENIKIDCIGSLLKSDDKLPIFPNFIEYLKNINQTSNAFKHSFINSDIFTIIGKFEPCIPALYLHHNNLNCEKKFTNLSLETQIIKPFDQLYSEVNNWLRDFSQTYKS